MLRILVHAAALLAAVALATAASAGADGTAQASKLRDPQDGWVDVSGFLDTSYGFLPVVAPITEPAVGYGAVGALVFIDRKPPTEGQGFVRPNIAAVGGLATQNGTSGVFAAHLGTWMDGRLHTLLGLADADVNLEFFGIGASPGAGGSGLDYTVAATGGVAGGNYRIGDHPLWVGVRYAQVQTRVKLHDSRFEQSVITPGDLDLRLAGLAPSLTLDTRDNFFTPTRGWYVDLSDNVFREALGGDRDFELLSLSAMYFRPLGPSLYFGVRGAGKSSSDGTPFFLRPFVTLRGVNRSAASEPAARDSAT
jgi:hypothetical protein